MHYEYQLCSGVMMGLGLLGPSPPPPPQERLPAFFLLVTTLLHPPRAPSPLEGFLGRSLQL